MKIKLSNVRLSFPTLWEPEQYNGKGKYFYSASFLLEKGSENYKKVMAEAVVALNAKFPGKGEALFKSIQGNNNRCCIVDGDATEYAGHAGHIAVRAKTKTRPLIIDANKTPLAEGDGKPYAGCYVNAQIEFFGYDSEGSKGLSAGLVAIQFAKDGDSFGGGSVGNADDFDDVSTGADSEDFV